MPRSEDAEDHAAVVAHFKAASATIVSLLATLLQVILGYLEVEPEGDLNHQVSAIQQLVEEMSRQGQLINEIAGKLGAGPAKVPQKSTSVSGSSSEPATRDPGANPPGTRYPYEWGPTPSAMEMKELGDKEVDCGTKHKKSSFRKVFETDPGYVSWMLGTSFVPTHVPQKPNFLGANRLRVRDPSAEDSDCRKTTLELHNKLSQEVMATLASSQRECDEICQLASGSASAPVLNPPSTEGAGMSSQGGAVFVEALPVKVCAAGSMSPDTGLPTRLPCPAGCKEATGSTIRGFAPDHEQP